MASPWVALLAVYDPRAPLITYGLSALVAGILVCLLISKVYIIFQTFIFVFDFFKKAFFLPETHKKKIPDTVEESENLKLSCFT